MTSRNNPQPASDILDNDPFFNKRNEKKRKIADSTLFEKYAETAMSAILMRDPKNQNYQQIAERAFEMADAMIEEYENWKEDQNGN